MGVRKIKTFLQPCKLKLINHLYFAKQIESLIRRYFCNFWNISTWLSHGKAELKTRFGYNVGNIVQSKDTVQKPKMTIFEKIDNFLWMVPKFWLIKVQGLQKWKPHHCLWPYFLMQKKGLRGWSSIFFSIFNIFPPWMKSAVTKPEFKILSKKIYMVSNIPVILYMGQDWY